MSKANKLLAQTQQNNINNHKISIERNKIVLYSILGIIILVSFFLFSSVFYPLFNSDDAVTVLMLHYFKLPDDIYFWTQNRVGSIIPLFGQIFHKGLGISALWSEAITHYIIIILGFLSFSTLLKSNFSKIIFAIIWFLPLLHFTSLLRFTFGLQYSLIGIAIYFLNKYTLLETKFKAKRFLLILSVFIIFVLSVWVTETAIVTIFIILFILGLFVYKSNNSISKTIFRYETLFSIILVIIGIMIIFFLKKSVIVSTDYKYNVQIFNTFNEFIQSIIIIIKIFSDIFSFKNYDLPISIYAYLVTFSIFLLLIVKKRNTNTSNNKKKWIFVLLLDGIALLLIILVSHWALLNDLERRYFTGVYITFWLASLIYIEHLKKSSTKRILQILLSITVIVGASSSVYHYKYVHPKTLKSKVKIVREFEQLGQIEIISNYWNAYTSSVVRPNKIFASPHDKTRVLNYDLVDSVFKQDKIFLIKDNWLDSFPTTINQFGYNLQKKGKMFEIANSWLCEYKKMPFKYHFQATDLSFIESSLNDDSVLYVNKDSLSYVYKYIIHGPYIKIPKGNYQVNFRLKVSKNNENIAFALIDITSNYGKKKLAKKILKYSDFEKIDTFENIRLDFFTEEYLKNVEFRIYYYGKVDFWFESVDISVSIYHRFN